MALVRLSFITMDTSVCRLICAANWHPYSTTNKGEVWALQQSKKPVGLCLSVLIIKFNNNNNCLKEGQQRGVC